MEGLIHKTYTDVYKGKKVIVTGHTGFKGCWLTLWLVLLGAEVVGISLEPDTEPNLFDILQLDKRLNSVIGDIRNKELIENLVDRHKPDFIFHLAAQPLVRRSYKEPHLTFETNVMGTVNVLEAVRNTNLDCKVINITSDKCYENKCCTYSYNENDAMGGYDPYSSSKGAAELVISAYRNSFFHPEQYGIRHKVAVASARAGNVIGGGDWAEDRLIPDFVRALSQNKDLIIRNPHATRPWQHVLECVSGYLHLGAKLNENPAEFAEGWNFGPETGKTMTVEQIVKKSIELWGQGNYSITPENTMKEACFLSLDTSKASARLKWKPVYDINQALEKTIGWYKYYYSKNVDMFEITKKQIEDYSVCYAGNFS